VALDYDRTYSTVSVYFKYRYALLLAKRNDNSSFQIRGTTH
jgi:hypothetical protein